MKYINKMNFYKEKLNFKKLTLYFIIIYIFFVSIVAHRPIFLTGEVGIYTITTAALQFNKSIFITDKTVQAVKEKFPDYYYNASRVLEDNRFPYNYKKEQYVNSSIYFPIYSFSCIPISFILGLMKLNQSYAFPITNALLLVIALLCIYKYLKTNNITKFIIIIFTAINPILYYILWASAEVFIYTFIVLSLIFYFNKAYKRSALFLTIAASLNMTVIGFAPIILISYLMNLKEKNNKIIISILNNKKDVFLFTLSFSFIILAFLYNYMMRGNIFSTVIGGSGSGSITTNSLQYITTKDRFFAYLFDLNYGFLPWYSFLFILHIVMFIISIINKRNEYILPTIGHFIIIIGYSIMTHINCGMSAISRYNAWSAPFIIFICIIGISNIPSYLTDIKNKYFKIVYSFLFKVMNIFLLFTLFLMIFFISKNGFPKENKNYGYGYLDFMPQAELVLNNTPFLYNPIFSTFINRVEHRDGGYSYRKPVIYKDSRNNYHIRKILLSISDTINKDIMDMFYFDNNKSKEYFNRQLIKNVNKQKEYFYINIPKKYKIIDNPYYIEWNENMNYELGSVVDMSKNNYYKKIGWAYPEGWGNWTDGFQTVLAMNIKSENDLILNLDIISIFNDIKSIDFYVNKVYLGSYDIIIGENKFVIPKELNRESKIIIRFVFDNLKSPVDLGQSKQDFRRLGIAVKSFYLTEKFK